MGQLLGKAYIRVDGDTLRTESGAKLDIGGVTRSAVNGSIGLLGFAEKTKEAMLECEVAVARGDSLDKFRKITNATVVFECDTGQSYIIKNACCQDPPVITEGEGGKVPLKFFGDAAEEQVS